MGPVDRLEALSRFVLQKTYIRADNTIRPAAFLPNPKNGETSVFRISGITDNEIWAIGDSKVAPKQNRPILGRADINASIVLSNYLEIIPSEPPERHADITGWPEEKSEQKQIALELAAESEFHKR
ncbi:MAG: hypothetical protein HOF76_21115 [Candidatus Scalindua sp.]|nr:hypothetical protein [Candidatus Scalindua sp.]MBT7589462.1 hypothetical protein [Candidatus Scalindua sp.]